MYSCYAVFQNGRIYAIVHTEAEAEGLVRMLYDAGADMMDLSIQGQYHTGLGF
jgi:hypothetical protein